MNRRALLATAAGLTGLSGCGGIGSSPGGSGQSTTRSRPTTVVGADGDPSNICERPVRPERIPAVLEPAFGADWSGVAGAPELADSVPVVGIERDGDARAYPVTLLRRFELVNDRFDIPVVVTYCPICSSGLTADRRVDGEPTVFGNTSHVWTAPAATGRQAIDDGRVFGVPDLDARGSETPTNDRNLVMYDHRTGSYWSQLLARAICGPLTGTELSLVPSTVTEWGTWRRNTPEPRVLLPPPRSKTARRR